MEDDGSDISGSAAAREQILERALRGESEAWKALLKERWGYLDGVIRDAAHGDAEAREAFMKDPWPHVIFCRVAEWADRRYHFSHDLEGHDMRDVLTETTREKITTLRHDNADVSWRSSFRSWCFSVAKSHSKNYLDRGRRKEEQFQSDVRAEHTAYRRGHADVMDLCEVARPEEEVAAEEREWTRQAALRKSHAAAVKETVRRVFDSLAEEERRLTWMWAARRMSYDRIAKEVGVSRTTVWRQLIPVFRLFVEEIEALIEELGRAEGKEVNAPKILKHLTKHRSDELRRLIAACSQGPAAIAPRPCAGA